MVAAKCAAPSPSDQFQSRKYCLWWQGQGINACLMLAALAAIILPLIITLRSHQARGSTLTVVELRKSVIAAWRTGIAFPIAAAATAAACEGSTALADAVTIFRSFVDSHRTELENLWQDKLLRQPERGIIIAAGMPVRTCAEGACHVEDVAHATLHCPRATALRGQFAELFTGTAREQLLAGRPAPLRHSLLLQTATSWQPFPMLSAPCMTDTVVLSCSPALTLSLSFPWQRVWPFAP